MLNIPDRQLSYLSISELSQHTRNPRKHTRAQVRAIANSIKSFGFNAPILVDGNQQIVAGHGRFAAAQLLGMRSVPVIQLSDLSDTQAKAYMLADNKLSDRSSWDEELLAIHLQELSDLALTFDLEDTGFELPEIDILLQSLDAVGGPDPDEFEIAYGAPVSRLGDVWELGPHRIICGSSQDADVFGTLLASERAAAVFTDPPYNVRIGGNVSGLGKTKHREFAMASGELSQAEFTAFLATSFTLSTGALMPGGLLYAFMDWRHLTEILAAGREAALELLNLCVWVKSNGGMGAFYRSRHELVFVFRNGRGNHRNNVQLGRFGRNRTNVWNYPGANAFSGDARDNPLSLHPTVKPIGLVADAILDSTKRGDIVLDPFAGSGTTILAAEKTKRRAFAIELDPVYVDTAIARWERMSGLKARDRSGLSFEDVMRARCIK